MNTLKQTRVVMQINPPLISGAPVTFKSTYDDTGEIYRDVRMSAQDWRDMGEPTEITLTITPGDGLNDG